MSEFILKRKTRHVLAPISGVGRNGFSINGGYRNKGAVGPTNLGISSTRTVYKGAYPVGHGGTDGLFVQNILSNGTCCTNDPAIVKRSTMSTSGLILSKVVFPTSVFTDCETSCVKNWVKDFNALNYSQGMFIQTLKIKNVCPSWLDETLVCTVDPSTCRVTCTSKLDGHPNTTVSAGCTPCSGKSHFIGGKKVVSNTISKKMRHGAMSSSDYLDGFLQARQCLPTPPCKQHFPPTLLRSGCDRVYKTPAEAIAAGVLPEDWGTCANWHHCGSHETHCIFQWNPYAGCQPAEQFPACHGQLPCPHPVSPADTELASITVTGAGSDWQWARGLGDGSTSLLLKVGNAVTSVVITGVPANPAARVEADPPGGAVSPLAVGDTNGVSLRVTLEERAAPPTTYEITIDRAPDADNALGNIEYTIGTVTTQWPADTTVVHVAEEAAQATVSAAPNSGTATIGHSLDGANGPWQATGTVTMAIVSGACTTVWFRVTAESGDVATYARRLCRAESSDSTLRRFELQEPLQNLLLNRAVDLPYAQNTFAIVAEAAPHAVISYSIRGSSPMVQWPASGQLSGLWVVGDNPLTLRVTSQSGDHADYSAVVTRAQPSADAGLATFALVNPQHNFLAGAQYTAATGISSVVVRAVPSADSLAAVEYSAGGGTWTSLTQPYETSPITLDYGVNTIAVRVTSEAGTTTTHTGTVVRAWPQPQVNVGGCRFAWATFDGQNGKTSLCGWDPNAQDTIVAKQPARCYDWFSDFLIEGSNFTRLGWKVAFNNNTTITTGNWGAPATSTTYRWMNPCNATAPCYRWFSLNPNQLAHWRGWGGSAGRVILTIELVNGTGPGETSRTIYVRPELDTNLLCQ